MHVGTTRPRGLDRKEKGGGGGGGGGEGLDVLSQGCDLQSGVLEAWPSRQG